ncbi:MAG: UDP-N-acetylmuramate--L-alanine ligase [Bdellovibrionaceae bacterium]|nr:UDP-N-acetylmuramate--L-alanine ligase [Pseudobdellovibrionaceae bacterium]MDW8190485.1 UDP-N-acetylmuramate--L-alanine ligase [Pseudobdellovibrionaceae bacterium]
MNFNRMRMHFVGIGGVGMSGIAELFLYLGAKVTGSDKVTNPSIEHLKKLGATIYVGHSEQYAMGSDVVVYSSAINKTNPEIQWALKNRIPLIPRAEALAELMRLKRGIAVAGTHGKTTTTSLIAQIFLEAQMSPTVVVGGRLSFMNSGAWFGSGEWFIAEADESDGSFLRLSSEVAVITNIDNDHLDHYKTLDQLYEAFYQFASRIPFYGYVLYWGDDERLRHLFSRFPKISFSYGFNQDNHFFCVKNHSQWDVYFQKELLGSFEPSMKGRHNVLNCLAAWAVGFRSGISVEVCGRALKNFQGVERRLQKLGDAHGVEFFTDYAHHPTEIRCTLEAFREMFPNRRIILVFQPHRYSRTEICWSDFLSCFSEPDVTYLIDIYGAGEVIRHDVTSARLAQEIASPTVGYVPNDQLFSRLRGTLRNHDAVLFMGAGDINRIGKDFVSHFQRL